MPALNADPTRAVTVKHIPAISPNDSQLFLKVSDNGIGKNDKEEYIGTGFGTKLIQLLTRQLEGKMNLDIENGTMVSFEFQHFKAA